MKSTWALGLILLIGGASAQASIEFEAQSAQGTWIVMDTVALPDGGYVVIHETADPSADSVVGVSRHLDAGNHTHVPVEIDIEGAGTVYAVLHEDDGDGRFDYVTSDGAADGPLIQDGWYVWASAHVEPGRPASVTFEDQDKAATLHVAHAELPAGGFVAVHYENFLDGDYFNSTAGRSELLSPGNHTDIVLKVDAGVRGFLLAVVHQDTDGDGVYDFDITRGRDDRFYIDGTTPVLDRGAVHSTGSGETVGAEREEEPQNGTPAPFALLLLVLVLVGRRR